MEERVEKEEDKKKLTPNNKRGKGYEKRRITIKCRREKQI